MAQLRRKTVLITGASGGMGKTIARRMGATMNLILTDLAAGPLEQFGTDLKNEGYVVAATVAGDLAEPSVLSHLTQAVNDQEGLDVLVHTAGLSPTQASWRKIINVNTLATQRLVEAVEAVLRPGAVAVLIASMAGHINPGMPDAERLLDHPIDAVALDQLEPFLLSPGASADAEAMASQLAYVLSKRAVIRLVEQLAPVWGRRDARIVSVSPGLIYTPMGVREADASTDTKATLSAQPLSRWGTAMDIANAVDFLTGPNASFITGCDLRVDGGASLLTTRG
jgi:NAD(P)-dependent dehydrogenase (short-subunit alcohol dehydrogenase family)